ncbi:MAG: TerC family protein [Bacteroidales bacterium]|nr:TerC family protein [Bacteroidales bacterium]
MEFVIALITLTILEVVLGIDNIIFISIVTNKLPKEEQGKARFIGLLFALIFRILLLILLVWMIQHLTSFFFPLEGMNHEQTIKKLEHSEGFIDKLKIIPHAIGVREIILFFGGIFLLAKSVSEVYQKMEGTASEHKHSVGMSMAKIILQIILLDIVFSFDSILTAVGITDNLPAMVSAVTIAMVVMLFFSKRISNFISKHPSLEMLALSFLILIGFMLMLEGVHIEVPKGYIYFAVFFSLIIELINMRVRKKQSKKVELIRKIKDEI